MPNAYATMSLVQFGNGALCITAAAVLIATPLLKADWRQWEGKTIADIEFPRDQPLYPDELRDILTSLHITKGAPLHQDDIRDSIQRLFETGRFADIQVDAAPGQNGVVVQFLTKNALFIGNVRVEGKIPQPPNHGQLANASGLDLGTPFDSSQLGAAEEGIRKLLVANGFYEATLTHEVKYEKLAQQANIVFTVEAGKRARYTEPNIHGSDVVLTPEKIIKSTGWRKFLIPGWRTVTQKRTRQAPNNVRVKYEKTGRLLATVELSKMDYEAAMRTVKPTLTIDAGPKVEIKTLGFKVSNGKLKKSVPIFEEHSVDNDLLREGANNLRDELQAAGYFDAQVAFQQKRAVGDLEEIDYAITPGERHRFVALMITGNHYFLTRTLRERMFLEPKSLQFWRGRFSDTFLRRDKESITNLYRANGLRDASVTSEALDDYKGKKGDLAVVLKIDEGKQWLVSHLEVTGYEKLDLRRILPTLASSEDQPFSEFNIGADREQILAYYGQNGFPNAQFSWTSTPGESPNVVNLTYSIKEGDQQFVRQVIYTGLVTTKPRLVNRQIRLNPGDPLSPLTMGETQRRLDNLGIFAKVDMGVQNPDGLENHKYVLYDMEEASRWALTGGFGAEIARIGGGDAANDLSSPGGATGFSPRVSLDLTRINFLGLGQTLSFRGRLSDLEQRGQINYLFPRILNHENFDLTLSAIYDRSYDVRTFNSQREEAAVQVTDRISKSTTAFFRFSYRDVKVSNLKIDPGLVPQLSLPTRTGILSGNLIQDTRDDPTDAHRGMYNTLDIGVAGRFFGGDSDFVRLLVRNATYHRFGQKLVFARQTGFGVMPFFGGQSFATSTDPDPIPLAERFYGGGADTLRAFPQNQAGARDLDTGFPLGGSTFLFNNTELRFPLFGDNIGGVLFEDFGNVYSKLSDISFAFSQPHPSDPTDFNYTVHAAGIGIRYRTPIGPVRLDLAYSINPPKYNGFKGSYQDLVNCSASNTCEKEALQISHFQFFFSIGQTF